MAAETANRQIGNYELLSKIAEGGMGAVYKARSIITSEIVAIKIVPAETAKNPVLMKRFEQEFRAASLFDHPNIVRAIEYCNTVSTPFLVMEFVDGESLGQRVERTGAMDEAEAIRAIAQVCDGLHRAHKQGLIHRDVKPDNILLRSDGVAKLTDMGLVKDVEGELNLTKTGRGLGTPHFMAPEQFRNAKNADVRCDIYSLGATLYMIVTGTVPFAKTSPLDCWLKKTKNDFDPPKRINPLLSDRVNRAILRAMSADPARRPTSCREFLEDLTGQPWTNRAEVTDTPLNFPITPELPETDLWYLVYKDATGQQKTVKGSTARIWDNLKAGMLGDIKSVLLCRTKAGPFVPVASVPEFRVLAVAPAVLAPEAVQTGRGPATKPPPNRPTIDPIGPTVPQPALPMPPLPAMSSNMPELPAPKALPPIGTPTAARQSVVRRTTAPRRKDESTSWLPWVFIGVTILVAAIGAAVLSR